MVLGCRNLFTWLGSVFFICLRFKLSLSGESRVRVIKQGVWVFSVQYVFFGVIIVSFFCFIYFGSVGGESFVAYIFFVVFQFFGVFQSLGGGQSFCGAGCGGCFALGIIGWLMRFRGLVFIGGLSRSQNRRDIVLGDLGKGQGVVELCDKLYECSQLCGSVCFFLQYFFGFQCGILVIFVFFRGRCLESGGEAFRESKCVREEVQFVFAVGYSYLGFSGGVVRSFVRFFRWCFFLGFSRRGRRSWFGVSFFENFF